MRCLVVFCHPSETSFGAAILETARTAIRDAGHDLRVIDLYRERFDPVLSAEEWHSYLADTARKHRRGARSRGGHAVGRVAGADLSPMDVRPARAAEGLARARLAARSRLRDSERPAQAGGRTAPQHQAAHGGHDLGVALVVAVPDSATRAAACSEEASVYCSTAAAASCGCRCTTSTTVRTASGGIFSIACAERWPRRSRTEESRREAHRATVRGRALRRRTQRRAAPADIAGAGSMGVRPICEIPRFRLWEILGSRASCPRWGGRDALDPGAATNRTYTPVRLPN